MSNSSILKVSEERWQLAQQEEHKYWSEQGWDGNDANEWWQEQFEDYKFLSNDLRSFMSMLEVGCGPFANNAKRMAKLFPHPRISSIHLQDPLMDRFISEGKSVAHFGHKLHTGKLEEMCLKRQFDLIVCINVLDHVQDVEACFERMHAHLNPGGILIVGNALSNDEDQQQCPESWTDSKHPMKMDLESLAPFLFKDYQSVFLKILARNQGRNSRAHYATLLWAGKKL